MPGNDARRAVFGYAYSRERAYGQMRSRIASVMAAAASGVEAAAAAGGGAGVPVGGGGAAPPPPPRATAAAAGGGDGGGPPARAAAAPADARIYNPPSWGTKVPAAGSWSLDVIKSGAVIETVDISGKPFYLVGRNADVCDVVLAHDSVSRQHAALQVRAWRYAFAYAVICISEFAARHAWRYTFAYTARASMAVCIGVCGARGAASPRVRAPHAAYASRARSPLDVCIPVHARPVPL